MLLTLLEIPGKFSMVPYLDSATLNDDVESQLALRFDIVAEHRHAAAALATVVNNQFGQLLDLWGWKAVRANALREGAHVVVSSPRDARDVVAGPERQIVVNGLDDVAQRFSHVGLAFGFESEAQGWAPTVDTERSDIWGGEGRQSDCG